jgi:hypothetical protein
MHVLSRIRMPAAALGAGAILLSAVVELPEWVSWSVTGMFALAMTLYIRVGAPAGPAASIAAPVHGPWIALNSPASRVPSHGVHAWSQTYAVDLVHDPGDGSRPGLRWWPLARRPYEFPGFGQPLLAPVAGEVVRARDGMRDHWSRTSPPALLFLLAESVRELLGPLGVLGNHVVIRRDDGACVLLAHLRRRSLRVARGDRVEAGAVVAECGNSGNSSEPHVHVQVMDRPSVWIAAGQPMLIEGREPPRNGDRLCLRSTPRRVVPGPGRTGPAGG